MIEDIYEPLAQYRDRFKDEYAKNTAAFFESMVQSSAVDEKANAETVAKIHLLDEQIKKGSSSSSKWKSLRVLTILVLIGSILVIVLFAGHLASPDTVTVDVGVAWLIVGLLVTFATLYLLIKKISPAIKALDDRLANLKQEHENEIHTAWWQLSALNQLYDWGMFAKIIQQTVPNLVLDPFVSLARLNELKDNFGWSDSFNENKSVVFAQSGEINGNPFVLAETLNFNWGEATYNGSLEIFWEEQETYIDNNGKSRTRMVTRSEILHASVTKPAPVYEAQKFLVYGNEAAPDLNFSRSPSSLSASNGGFWGKMRLKHEINKLEKLSRDLDKDSGFTIMANEEFDALFHSIDRDNEVQYRILFTPLAQQQMVMLLKDKDVGFGDDFCFEKVCKLNFVQPAHINNVDIAVAPGLFVKYDLAEAREFFNSSSNNYFRHFYFTLAPILAIPIYQQYRSHADIYKNTLGKVSSFWEHESLANFYGQGSFRHPESVTQNILKTCSDSDGHVDVTAHGFRGEDRVEYVSVYGRDRAWHNVPVHWTEYLPVQRTTQMAVRETDGLGRSEFEKLKQTDLAWKSFVSDASAGNFLFRRSIASVLMTNGR